MLRDLPTSTAQHSSKTFFAEAVQGIAQTRLTLAMVRFHTLGRAMGLTGALLLARAPSGDVVHTCTAHRPLTKHMWNATQMDHV